MLDPRVSTAIADVFGIAPDEVNLQSSHETIPDWDSVGHFKLILHLEEVFGIRFPSDKIGSLTTVNKIQEALTGLGVLP
ncbi:MAG: acyl carrier protein [Terriglobia bacterium]